MIGAFETCVLKLKQVFHYMYIDLVCLYIIGDVCFQSVSLDFAFASIRSRAKSPMPLNYEAFVIYQCKPHGLQLQLSGIAEPTSIASDQVFVRMRQAHKRARLAASDLSAASNAPTTPSAALCMCDVGCKWRIFFVGRFSPPIERKTQHGGKETKFTWASFFLNICMKLQKAVAIAPKWLS